MENSKLVLFATLALSLPAWAGVRVLNLPVATLKPQPALSSLRNFEEQENFESCAKSAASLFAKEDKVRGWVLATWLRCARRNENPSSEKQLKTSLQAFDRSPQLRSGPWEKALYQEQLKARFKWLDQEIKKKPAQFANELDTLIENLEPGDRESFARAYALYGDWAQAQRDPASARIFYEQSLNEKDNKSVREKYSQVLLALNDRPSEKKASESEEFISEAEKKSEERMAQSQKNNDLLSLVEDCISHLNRFPNGRKAKWAADRALEIYSYLNEQSVGTEEKWTALRERALVSLEKAEPVRLNEWARILHRRSDFPGSLRLAEKALSLSPQPSVSNASLYYVVGRSAQLTGEDRKAQKAFEKYAEFHSAGEDIGEVLFRLGLVHLRQGQSANAIAVYERLLSMKNQDRYELSAQYWMLRALEELQNPRANELREQIIQKYPQSYYGLKLRAESKGGVLEAGENSTALKPVVKGKIPLTAAQQKSWERIQILAAAGWRSEVITEAAQFPNPEDPRLKSMLADLWATASAPPLVIKLSNQAADSAKEFREWEYVKKSFPKDYTNLIENESKKAGLHPILVWSLIRQESAFHPKAVSSSNAMGLMQLIPPTAREVAQNLKWGNLELPDDGFNPVRNIPMGTNYLSQMIRQFENSVPLGLAAYNAGPTRMQNFLKLRPTLRTQIVSRSEKPIDEIWMDEVPWFETSFYVKAILRNSLLYRLLDEGRVKVEMCVWKDLLRPSLNPGQGPTSASVGP